MQEDYDEVSASIEVPVLVVAGELDRLFDLGMVEEEVHWRNRGGTLVVIEECGHLIPLEKPGVLAGEIEKFVDLVDKEEVRRYK